MSAWLLYLIGALYLAATIDQLIKGNYWMCGFLITLSVLQFVQVKAFNIT